MNYPREFGGIQVTVADLSPPARQIHPTLDGISYLQFITDSGEEFLAVQDVEPYGVRTEEASDPQTDDLIPIVYTGSDYRLFGLSEDLLTVEAISLGSGSSAVDKLETVYENLGGLLVREAEKYSLPPTDITNFAFFREAGRLVFKPAYRFSTGQTDTESLVVNVADSIRDNLTPARSEHRIRALIDALFRGVDYENNK